MINIDKEKIKTNLLRDEDFPFSPVSFYLKYLIYREVIDIFDVKLEQYNDLLCEFANKCHDHETTMKIINYTISQINQTGNKVIQNFFSYLKSSLYKNLKGYFFKYQENIVDENTELPF